MKPLILNIAQALTAAADTSQDAKKAPDSRIVEGIILPWGKTGMTSNGKLSAQRGCITIPDDVGKIKLLRDHSYDPRHTPVGHATEIIDTPDGLLAKFHIADTPDGDVAITDIKERLRDSLSVELIDHKLDGDTITAGTLISVALVHTPAFDDARVTSLTAARETTTGRSSAVAAAPIGIEIRHVEPELSAASIYESLVRIANGEPSTNILTAALKSLDTAKSPLEFAPQWVGQLWQSVPFTRRVINTMTHKDLESQYLRGWRWKKEPTVDTWEGNGAIVASTGAEGEKVEVKATSLAGVDALPIETVHFHQVDVIEDFFTAQAKSYAKKSEQKALEDVLAAAGSATDISAKKPSLLKSAAWARLLIGRWDDIEPAAYLVNDEDYFDLIDLRTDDLPAFLKLIGAEPDIFIPTPHMTKGTLLAYAAGAFTHGELKGSPIRVNALDAIKGQTHNAVFGWRAVLCNQPHAIAHLKFAEPS